jgi:hypothetical protein
MTMRSGSAVRLSTIAAVLAICGYTALRGSAVAEFAIGEARGIPTPAVADWSERWGTVAGVAGEVLAASLRRTAPGLDRASTARRAATLARRLAMRPLSARDWLALAGARAAAGAPDGTVEAALTMSYLTGPNEGPVMVQRGMFGLLRWEGLPGEARARTGRDLAGALLGGSIRPEGFGLLRRIVAAKSPAARAEIADALASERLPEAELARLGLR